MDQKEAIESIKEVALEYAKEMSTEITSSQLLSGSGPAWFYDPVNKTMELVIRGDTIISNKQYVDHKNRILSHVSGKVVLIPPDEIIDIGFN